MFNPAAPGMPPSLRISREEIGNGLGLATAGQSSAEDLRAALAFAAAMSLSKLNVEKPTPSVERGNDLYLDQQVWVDQRGHADHG